MGLAASQGRMLLLTARKSDLEFRAQQISQKRLILAQQLEDISTEYEDTTSNRQMKIRLYEVGKEGEEDKKAQTGTFNLTYATLVSASVGVGEDDCLRPCDVSGTDDLEYKSSTKYRLVDDTGAIVVASVKEIPGYNEKTGKVDGFKYAENGDKKYRKEDKDGNEIKYVVDPNLAPHKVVGTNGTTDGPNYLQECLRNGKYLVQKPKTDGDETKWHNISWDAAGNITDSYYQDDDDAAKAKYDRLQNEVQRQDKKLELELDNVETQRNAVKTEMDSVDKVMEENVEKTFNTFG